MSTTLKMRQLASCIQARIPALLWGPPGVGKTAMIEQIAEELDAGFVPLAASTRPPEDFAGLPVPREGKGVIQEPMSWIIRALDLAEKHKGGCVVLFDEFSNCVPATASALLSLVQSRYCGDTIIPRSVAFVAAANPPSEAADGWELAPPTISRWAHIEWPAPTIPEWSAWLVGHSVEASDKDTAWDSPAGAKARGAIVGFLNFSQSSFMGKAGGQVHGRADAYPCPRTWEMAARLLAQTGDDPDLYEDLVAGAVGNGVAGELCEWIRDADLPNPEDLLRDPKSWEVPRGRADKALATLLGVTGAVQNKATQDRLHAAVAVACRVNDVGMSGVVLVALRQLFKHASVAKLTMPDQLEELGPLTEAAGAAALLLA